MGDQGETEQVDEKLSAGQRALTAEALFDGYKCTLETMYHLKDRLQVVDQQYMFQNLQDVA
eukprot:15086276-Ditylum_brightwellii.AAC.1